MNYGYFDALGTLNVINKQGKMKKKKALIPYWLIFSFERRKINCANPGVVT